MAVITIARELAALGDETAHELAEQLGYRLVDKRSLEAGMKNLGVEESKISRYDEKKPSFLASLSQDKDDYLHYLKTVIYTEAGQGNCIFIGRGCAAIMRGFPGVVSVFLAAPSEVRLERVKSYFHCDDKRAKQILDQSDRNREGFYHYFFDTAWRTPENYHLTLNTGFLAPELCAGIIKNLRGLLVNGEDESSLALIIKDRILGQQIIQHILFEKNIPVHFLEASVTAGEVVLYGVANSQSLIECAIAGAKEVPAVSSVHSEIQIVQEYSLAP
ncbi:MAG: cytidylate kinase family protein [Treponema sp.]|jgi:cytidylate kinase|nr:cytidylate kinase family protein [Treponema sp.]